MSAVKDHFHDEISEREIESRDPPGLEDSDDGVFKLYRPLSGGSGDSGSREGD